MEWYYSGKLKKKTYFRLGKPVGDKKTYHPNGEVEFLCHYHPAGKIKYIHAFSPTGKKITLSKYFNEQVFTNPDKPAYFKDGEDALHALLLKTVKQPEHASKARIHNEIIVQVVIDEEGQVTNPTIEKSGDMQLNEEAKRVVLTLPRWQPGEMMGFPVKTYVEIPVTFRIK